MCKGCGEIDKEKINDLQIFIRNIRKGKKGEESIVSNTANSNMELHPLGEDRAAFHS
jgi:hypothetical protein